MKKFTKTLVSLFLVLSAAFASAFAEKVSFTAKDINNKNITDAVFADAKVTMINIWGTFCGPCIAEMPELAELNKNNSEKGLQVVGIVIDAINRKGNPLPKVVDSAKKIAGQTGADYIHIVPNAQMQNGLLKNIQAVPTTIFVDSEGNIIGETYTGARSLADWQKIVDSLLK